MIRIIDFKSSEFSELAPKSATAPEVAVFRIKTDALHDVSRQNVTSFTGRYCGLTKGGYPILIVAHGIGPLSRIKTVMEKNAVYDFVNITKTEFQNLESGYYGDVDIIDLKAYSNSSNYPFIEDMTICNLKKDQVVRAYLKNQTDAYLDWLAERFEKNKKSFRVSIDSFNNTSFPLFKISKMLGSSDLRDKPIGSLVSLSSVRPEVINKKNSAHCLHAQPPYDDILLCRC